MATNGTPYEGRDNVIARELYEALSSAGKIDMALYTNAADSLGVTSVIGDLAEPTGDGYARIVLTNSWDFTNGQVQYTGTQPAWTNSSAAAWADTVIGSAMIAQSSYSSTEYILHFKDFVDPATPDAGETITVDVTTVVG